MWKFFSMFGDIQYWIGIGISTLLIYQILPKTSKKKITWIIFILLPAVLFSYQLTYVLKLWFQIPRPCSGMPNCPSTYSFPSGHSAVIFAFAFVSCMNVKKKEIYVFTIPLAFVVALSRVFLNYHTYVDIVAGASVGVFCGYLMAILYKRIRLLLI